MLDEARPLDTTTMALVRSRHGAGRPALLATVTLDPSQVIAVRNGRQLLQTSIFRPTRPRSISPEGTLLALYRPRRAAARGAEAVFSG